MSRRQMKIERAGHAFVAPQIAKAGSIAEPSYRLINTIAMNTSLGSLSSMLAYRQAAAEMEMRKGRRAIEDADRNTQDAYDRASQSSENLNQTLQREEKETKRRLSILEQQKKFFDGVTTSNIFSDYNERITEAERNDINENPGG